MTHRWLAVVAAVAAWNGNSEQLRSFGQGKFWARGSVQHRFCGLWGTEVETVLA